MDRKVANNLGVQLVRLKEDISVLMEVMIDLTNSKYQQLEELNPEGEAELPINDRRLLSEVSGELFEFSRQLYEHSLESIKDIEGEEMGDTSPIPEPLALWMWRFNIDLELFHENLNLFFDTSRPQHRVESLYLELAHKHIEDIEEVLFYRGGMLRDEVDRKTLAIHNAMLSRYGPEYYMLPNSHQLRREVDRELFG